jgi:hypothetical protein
LKNLSDASQRDRPSNSLTHQAPDLNRRESGNHLPRFDSHTHSSIRIPLPTTGQATAAGFDPTGEAPFLDAELPAESDDW